MSALIEGRRLPAQHGPWSFKSWHRSLQSGPSNRSMGSRICVYVRRLPPRNHRSPDPEERPTYSGDIDFTRSAISMITQRIRWRRSGLARRDRPAWRCRAREPYRFHSYRYPRRKDLQQRRSGDDGGHRRPPGSRYESRIRRYPFGRPADPLGSKWNAALSLVLAVGLPHHNPGTKDPRPIRRGVVEY